MKKIARVISVGVSFAIIAGSVFVVQNRQAVQDWIALQTYTPTAQIKSLATNATFTPHGRQLFYASHPSIDNQGAFNQHCTNRDEQSIVLGCYSRSFIYIYNVTDPRLTRVKEVTAAHEMLHAAYDRLGKTERDKLNEQLGTQFKLVADERLINLINLYRKTEPGELYNEMHSILATEARQLSPELETYYKRYFENRLQVVAYSEEYEGVFTASKKQIAEYDKQLEILKAQINANDEQLSAQQASLVEESRQLDELRASNPEEYNRRVPLYNAKAKAYNGLLAESRSLVEQYNVIVEKRNAEVANERDLTKSVDSRFQPAE